MKYYLSGKMTGLKEKEIWNNFSNVEKLFCKKGSVMNPAVTYAMRNFDGFSYDDWLKIDFAMMDACDGIVLLPNWETSMGAKREIVHAWENNKQIIFPYENVYGYKFTDGKKYVWRSVCDEVVLDIVLEVKKHDLMKKLETIKDAAITEAAMQEINKIKEEKWQ